MYQYKYFDRGFSCETVIDSLLRDRDLELAFLRDAISRKPVRLNRRQPAPSIKTEEKELKEFFATLTPEQIAKVRKAGLL